MSDVRDLIVIGGGPAGYTAALYAARANLRPLVIEGFGWGGQLMITSDVENYPGYPDGIMGPEMMAEFRRQAERFGTDFVTDDVTRVDFSERPFRVWVEDEEYQGRSVIIATGVRDLRRRLLPRQAHLCRRRRRHSLRGGALPHALRLQGHDRPSPERVPRLADHGRPGTRTREGRVQDAVRRRRGARRELDQRPAAPQHRDR